MDRTELQLPKELTLSWVTELRQTLLTALRSGKAIELDTTDVAEVDVAGLQLLCALHRDCARLGIPLTFQGGSRGKVIEEAHALAGFTRVKGCAKGCLWEECKRG